MFSTINSSGHQKFFDKLATACTDAVKRNGCIVHNGYVIASIVNGSSGSELNFSDPQFLQNCTIPELGIQITVGDINTTRSYVLSNTRVAGSISIGNISQG